MTLPACGRIIELSEKATPGPWEYGAGCFGNTLIALIDTYEGWRDDMELVSTYRTLAPKIALALNEAVRAIEEAEHAVGCDGECALFIGGPAEGCTCWKQTALARINELLK